MPSSRPLSLPLTASRKGDSHSPRLYELFHCHIIRIKFAADTCVVVVVVIVAVTVVVVVLLFPLQAIVKEETHAAPHLSHVPLDKETVTTTRNAFLVKFKTYKYSLPFKSHKNCLNFDSGLVCGTANCVGPTFGATDDCCEAPPGKV